MPNRAVVDRPTDPRPEPAPERLPPAGHRPGSPGDQPAPVEGAVERIAAALEGAGLDAPALLYQEALRLAREGHLGRARDRLRWILCMRPDHGSAHLLLARVFAHQKRFEDACAELDAAFACGERVDPAFRETCERGRELARTPRTESPRQASARDAEVKGLREELRRARSEHARLARQARRAEQRARLSTAVALGSLLLAGLLPWLLPRGGEGEDAPSLEGAAVQRPIAPAPMADPEGRVALEAPPVDPALPATTEDPTGASPATPVPAAPPEVPAEEATPHVAPAPAEEATPHVAPAAATATPRTAPPRTWTVRRGDNLFRIAREVYGRGADWPLLYEANRDLLPSPEDLQVGMVLRVPERPGETRR